MGEGRGREIIRIDNINVKGYHSFCGTRLTLPGNICFVKDIVRDVHAVLVVPSLTHVTLGHFITLFLRQAAGAVKVH